MAPVNKPPLKAKPKIMLPRSHPTSKASSVAQPGPSNAGNSFPSPPRLPPSTTATAPVVQPGPSNSGPYPTQIPRPVSAGGSVRRPYSTTPRRLPVFTARPASTSGEAAEPISPIQPVGQRIEDLTFPLNSTAYDESNLIDLNTPEPEEEISRPKARRYARKQVSPEKNNSSNKVMSKALHEIRRYQSGTELLIPKASFRRLARSCRSGWDYRWAKDALEALQEACEDYLVQVFMKGQVCAQHAKRITLQPVDILLAQRLEEL